MKKKVAGQAEFDFSSRIILSFSFSFDWINITSSLGR